MEGPTRKQNRLPQFDYSTPRAYFITICTQNRRNLLWDNVGAAIRRPEDVILSGLGHIVRRAILNVSSHYPMITVDQYTIMPNHIHLLLQIHSDSSGRRVAAPTISTIINQLKGAATRKAGFPLWQKGFYDHVIRGESDYLDTWNYIYGNPLRWESDNLYHK